jgi:hypothetical protein
MSKSNKPVKVPGEDKVSEKLNIKLIAAFFLLSIIISAPFIYHFLQIIEVYVDSDVRKQALNSVFLLREEYGLTVGDLTIKDVSINSEEYIIVVHEYYHGFIDRSKYNDLVRDYIVKYDRQQDKLSVESIKELS